MHFLNSINLHPNKNVYSYLCATISVTGLAIYVSLPPPKQSSKNMTFS